MDLATEQSHQSPWEWRKFSVSLCGGTPSIGDSNLPIEKLLKLGLPVFQNETGMSERNSISEYELQICISVDFHDGLAGKSVHEKDVCLIIQNE